MACTIQATAMHAQANSYATIEEGDDYHETHPYSDAWDDSSEDEKCRALVTATRMLDTWFEWHGDASSSDQALLWPRDGAVAPNGYILPNDTVPDIIKNATIELARNLRVTDRTADSDTETQGLAHVQAGPIAVSFKSGVAAKPIPDAVMVMASQLGVPRNRTGSGAIHLYRG